MKKTLVALAVLATSGATFAQVTVTGSLIMGYRASTAPAGDTSGFGVDTSEIIFTATEDLGDGLKASASMALRGADRSGAGDVVPNTGTVTGGDAALALGSASTGTVTLKSARSADYLSAGVSGVGGITFDGKVFSARTAADSIAYGKNFGPVALTLTHKEVSEAQGTTRQGLGIGGAGAAAGLVNAAVQRKNTIGLKYTAGPLVIDGGYSSYDNKAGGTFSTDDSSIVLSGSYDLGVVKFGLGAESRKKMIGTRTDTFAAVSVPFGAFTLGADFAKRDDADTGAAATTGSKSGVGLAATYALSKRTSLIANYGRWDQTIGATSANTETNLLISHTF